MIENSLPDDASPDDVGGPTLEEALLQIAELDKKASDAHDKMLRALAEADNTRRRADRDRQETAKFSVAGFARDLLAVSDNLRRALNAMPLAERNQNEQLKSIHAGVEATERELMRVFEANGIKQIDPLHQKFDPNLHEVIFESPSALHAPGTVVQVVEPGYLIHERLLRPARVGIAKGEAMPGAGTMDEQV